MKHAAWLLPLALFIIYNLNGDFLPVSDATGNAYLPVSILTEGNLTFTPDEAPRMFSWVLMAPDGPQAVQVHGFDQTIAGRRAGDLYEAGHLKLGGPQGFLVTAREYGAYANTFGVGAGITALPFYAVGSLVVDGLLRDHAAILYTSKLVASLLVALSALFVFLTCRRLTPEPAALIAAAAYGLGTCVWSISTQSLWQHGPNEFFLALGLYFATRVEEGQRMAAGAGGALAAAVVCRPTSAIVVAVVGAWLLIHHRRALPGYILAGAPIAVLLAAYNWTTFGSIFDSGQLRGSEPLAFRMTGNSDLWQSPLLTGAAGQLFSPSRGLFVYSPFMLFALPGAVAVWRESRLAALRPVTLAIPLLWVVAFKWWDWIGGWCYGYRPLVDTMPLLALLLAPGLALVSGRRWLGVASGVLLAWSVYVQVLGAFAYNVAGWNARRSEITLAVDGREEPVQIDDEFEAKRLVQSGRARLVGMVELEIVTHPERVWSLRDTQIGYYTRHFANARKERRELVEKALRSR